MGSLQVAVERALHEQFSPENLLFLAIAHELRQRGIELSQDQERDIRRQVATCIETGSFSIELPSGWPFSKEEEGDREVVIAPDLDAFLDRVLGEIPAIMMSTVDALAAPIAEQVLKDARRNLRKSRRRRIRFERNLRRRWGRALDLFEVLHWVCLESGAEFNQEVSTVAREGNDMVFFVLVRLHARACLVASEVSTLARGGFADGAHARWRTLHEIAVIANFIKKHGRDVAERFVLHDAIESRRAARLYQANAQALGMRRFSDEEMATVERRAKDLLTRFGTSYAGDYGWAAAGLDHPRPKFADIENDVGLDFLRPYYKLASHNVHSNPRGTFFKLGLMGDESILLAGPSNAGLVEPLSGAAVSLLNTTVTLLTHEPNVDRLVACKVIFHIEKMLGEALSAAHRQLVSDEEALRAPG